MPISAIESVSSARRPMRVADRAEHDAADRPGEEAQCEDAKRQQLLRRGAVLREELVPDVGGEVAVDREVEPLEHVADQAGQRRPQGGLGRRGHFGVLRGVRAGLRRCRIGHRGLQSWNGDSYRKTVVVGSNDCQSGLTMKGRS